jgi:hypothetical protein
MSTEAKAKPLKDWFTFEYRCLVCGRKIGIDAFHTTLRNHLWNHCEDGVMEKIDHEMYRQVKADPVGFPGILLPKEMVWSE